MKNIVLDYSNADDFIAEHELLYMTPKIKEAHKLLHGYKGPGKEYTDWLELPLNYNKEEFEKIKNVSSKIKDAADVLIVIGIGGSYLGARSALEMLKHNDMEVYFAGNNISSTYLNNLINAVKDKEIAVNVVSKSGKTLEPAVAFRIFKKLLEEKYGKKEAGKRIIATTDEDKGALKKLADIEGYETFIVPDGIGGRYSVLTPVGLFPMAAAGIDIDEVMEGAKKGYYEYKEEKFENNSSYQYAAIRNILYSKGKTLELLVNYEPDLKYFAEWWKQLYGESEGKDGKGIFPASVNFSTDLHSLGQYIQDGLRNLFATTLWIEKSNHILQIPETDENLDGLNYLAGRDLHEINEKACEGTIMAHTEGGVPNLKISIPEINPYYYGQLVYFFEKACAVSGYILGVNPFNQPGVEAYKKNMFALLK